MRAADWASPNTGCLRAGVNIPNTAVSEEAVVGRYNELGHAASMPDRRQWLAKQTDLHWACFIACFKGWGKSVSRRDMSVIDLAFELLGFFPLLVV